MKQTLAMICGLLFVALPTLGQSKSDQDKSKDKAQIVSTAEITKIDAKKKVLQVRNVVEANTSSPSGSSTGRRSGGGYPGGGRRRYPGYPGGGYPGGGYPGGGGRYPGGGTSTSQNKEYKVFITKDTVLKLEDMDMEFSDLHVGDRVVLSGTPKGSNDVEATAVTRKFN